MHGIFIFNLIGLILGIKVSILSSAASGPRVQLLGIMGIFMSVCHSIPNKKSKIKTIRIGDWNIYGQF